MGDSGVSGELDRVSAQNEHNTFGVERFCNSVAGEFLLPQEELKSFNVSQDARIVELADYLGTMAKTRYVSRSMIAYKLCASSVISREQMSELSALFRSQWSEKKRKEKEKNKNKRIIIPQNKLTRYNNGAYFVVYGLFVAG